MTSDANSLVSAKVIAGVRQGESATGYGYHSARIIKVSELKQALKEALARTGKATFFNVICSEPGSGIGNLKFVPIICINVEGTLKAH